MEASTLQKPFGLPVFCAATTFGTREVVWKEHQSGPEAANALPSCRTCRDTSGAKGENHTTMAWEQLVKNSLPSREAPGAGDWRGLPWLDGGLCSPSEIHPSPSSVKEHPLLNVVSGRAVAYPVSGSARVRRVRWSNRNPAALLPYKLQFVAVRTPHLGHWFTAGVNPSESMELHLLILGLASPPLTAQPFLS